MAASFNPNDFAIELCKALGIDPDITINVGIEARVDSMPIARVEMMLDGERAERVLEIMRRYEVASQEK